MKPARNARRIFVASPPAPQWRSTMRRKTTRLGCLGMLLAVALHFAYFSWSEGGSDKGSAVAVMGALMLVVIYVNDGFERLKEKREQEADFPPARRV